MPARDARLAKPRRRQRPASKLEDEVTLCVDPEPSGDVHGSPQYLSMSRLRSLIVGRRSRDER
jgi:hypothetical protein